MLGAQVSARLLRMFPWSGSYWVFDASASSEFSPAFQSGKGVVQLCASRE